MKVRSERGDACFNFSDKEVIDAVKRLLATSQTGILGTVDKDGRPRLRWMATFSFEEFPVFYSLASPDSRKIGQLKLHPDVNWMFSSDELDFVVNLVGKGRVFEDTTTLKRVWRQIEDKSQAYFLNQYVKGPGFVVIETTVETIECSSPKNPRKFSINTSDLLDIQK